MGCLAYLCVFSREDSGKCSESEEVAPVLHQIFVSFCVLCLRKCGFIFHLSQSVFFPHRQNLGVRVSVGCSRLQSAAWDCGDCHAACGKRSKMLLTYWNRMCRIGVAHVLEVKPSVVVNAPRAWSMYWKRDSIRDQSKPQKSLQKPPFPRLNPPDPTIIWV